MRKNLLALLSSFTFIVAPAFAGSTIFDRIDESFHNADVPSATAVRGYWAGRCVDKTNPDHLMPAVFVYKTVRVDGDFPPNRPTMSYFYDSTGKEGMFDMMSPSQIERHPSVERWFAKEQWARAEVANGSIENDYLASDKVTIHRALRSYATQFDKTLLLQVARIENGSSGVRIDQNVYCFFDNYRGKDISGPITPSDPPLSAEIGPVSNSYVELINDHWSTLLSAYEITNLGMTTVRLMDIQWVTATGLPVVDNRAYSLRGGETIRFHLAGATTFQLRQLRFFVSGATSRMRVRGIPAN